MTLEPKSKGCGKFKGKMYQIQGNWIWKKHKTAEKWKSLYGWVLESKGEKMELQRMEVVLSSFPKQEGSGGREWLNSSLRDQMWTF